MLWVWALIHEKCPSPLFLILAHVKSLTLELTIYRIVRPSAKFANEKAHFFLLNKRQLTVSGTSRPRGVNKKAKTFHFDYHFRYCFQIFVFLIFTFVFLYFSAFFSYLNFPATLLKPTQWSLLILRLSITVILKSLLLANIEIRHRHIVKENHLFCNQSSDFNDFSILDS